MGTTANWTNQTIFTGPFDLMPALKFRTCEYVPYHLRRVFDAVNDGVAASGLGENSLIIDKARLAEWRRRKRSGDWTGWGA